MTAPYSNRPAEAAPSKSPASLAAGVDTTDAVARLPPRRGAAHGSDASTPAAVSAGGDADAPDRDDGLARAGGLRDLVPGGGEGLVDTL
mmetsp:Transcript_10774/g.37540  ORF Transcript_10774/g.37540 Transcript_10774/m.37540 type:complete len:89 (-) Transcript_10774:186-452(-)